MKNFPKLFIYLGLVINGAIKFLLNIAGIENPQIGEYVYYMPQLWKFISEISPGVYRVESCLSRTRKVSTLELLAPANIRPRALQTEVELQNQCAQLEKLKSTNSLLQKDLVELRQKLDKHCDKAEEATREALAKLSAECEALRDNLKAAAARNADQEQSIDLLKQELANLKVNNDKKSEAREKMEKENDQLRSKLQQLENYNQYLASECRRKATIIDRQKHSLKNEKAKTKAAEKCLFAIRNKNVLNRPATLYEILLVKSSASTDQIKKHYYKMSLLTHPDAGGDEEFFKTINRAYQILMNDGAREAYNNFGLDEAEKVMNDEN